MYNHSMMPVFFRKKVPVHSLSPGPGIDIWYSRIPDIIDLIFSPGNYHNFRTMGNKLFTHESFSFPFLNEEEFKTVNRFKSLKKQVEWISGRFLIKQLVMDTLNLDHLDATDLLIAYHDQGAPYLPDFPENCISISHSGNLTAASICTLPHHRIGLDIETVGKKPDMYFLKTAFTEREISRLDDTAESIFRHWTLKEAFLKYIRKGFNESLHHVEILGNEIFHHHQKAAVFVYSIPIDPDMILSLVAD